MSNVTIIQPNTITNARYDFTALQKNIIYYVIEALQKHMTRDKTVNMDLFHNFVVSVPVSKICTDNNHSKVIEAAKLLMTKPFQYNYMRDNGTYTVATVLVHTAEHRHNSETIELTIPDKAIGLLIYIAEGFTPIQKTIAITLKSKHSKRMYELCCRWRDRGGFVMSLSEFKSMLCIEDRYKDINRLKDQVLDFAQKELKSSADVWFEYDLMKLNSRSFNQINFKIFSNDIKQVNADKGLYLPVYNYLNICYPNYITDKAQKITDNLLSQQKLTLAWSKFRPYLDKFKTNEIEPKHLINITTKILKDDFNIN